MVRSTDDSRLKSTGYATVATDCHDDIVVDVGNGKLVTRGKAKIATDIALKDNISKIKLMKNNKAIVLDVLNAKVEERDKNVARQIFSCKNIPQMCRFSGCMSILCFCWQGIS